MLRRTSAVLTLAIFVLACITLTGCPAKKGPEGTPSGAAPVAKGPEGKDGKKIKIAIVTNAVAPFWTPMTVGMKKAAEEVGCEANWQGPPNAQVTEQRRLLENYVAQGVDGIAVSPIDAKAIGPVLDDIVAKGINVVCIDSDAPDTKRLGYIGTNNYKAGLALGEETLKLLPEKSKVVAFVGTLSAQNAQERLKGFKDAVAKKQIEVIDTKQDNTDKNKARKNVEDTIQAHPEVAGLIGLWSYNLPAISAAVKEAKKHDKIKVIGFDAEPQTISGLEAGDVDATVVQKPYMFGYLAVKLLYAIATKDQATVDKMLPKEKVIDTGVEVVTPKSVADYKKSLKDLGIESS